jgi:hypothetical protein
VVEHARLVQAIAQQEIGKGNTARAAGNSVAVRPAAIESESAAGDVRLSIVVVGLYQLAAELKGVTSLDPGHVRLKGELRIVVGDEALALRTSNGRILRREAGRERRTPGSRNQSVVA